MDLLRCRPELSDVDARVSGTGVRFKGVIWPVMGWGHSAFPCRVLTFTVAVYSVTPQTSCGRDTPAFGP